MTRDRIDIQARVLMVVEKIKKNKELQVEIETDLFAVGVLDSFGMLGYIAAIEEEFNISIPNEDLIPQNLWSVLATVETVEKFL
jgi:acyl carrier protein